MASRRLCCCLPLQEHSLFFYVLEYSAELQKIQQASERKARREHLAAESARRQEAYEIARGADLEKKARDIKREMPEICKKSGEHIYRKAENVTGVLLLEKEYNKEYTYPGYRHVDYISLSNGAWKRYRSDGEVEDIGKLDPASYGLKYKSWSELDWNEDSNYRQYIDDFIGGIASNFAPPRYAVIDSDVSTPDERNKGISGWSLKVIDLQAKEVMSEQISYRVLWKTYARELCPELKLSKETIFVVNTLMPSQFNADWEYELAKQNFKQARQDDNERRMQRIAKLDKRSRQAVERWMQDQAQKAIEFEQEQQQADQRAREVMPEICKKSSEFIYHETENVPGFLWLGDAGPPTTDIYDYVDFINVARWLRTYRDGTTKIVGERWDALNASNMKMAKWGDLDYEKFVLDFMFDESLSPDPKPPHYVVVQKSFWERERTGTQFYGRSLKVIDLKTKELMAERIGYSYGMQSSNIILICPPYSEYRKNEGNFGIVELRFIAKVLKPSPEPTQ